MLFTGWARDHLGHSVKEGDELAPLVSAKKRSDSGTGPFGDPMQNRPQKWTPLRRIRINL
jgi:hypothetical protein